MIDHWWQTETGWPIAANLRGLEPMTIKPGSPTVPVPGWDVRVLAPRGRGGARCRGRDLRQAADAARSAADAVARRRALRRVLSVGLRRLLPHRRRRHVDEDGYLFVMGRTDDVINVAGHRLSTGTLEAVLSGIRPWPSARSSACTTS